MIRWVNIMRRSRPVSLPDPATPGCLGRASRLKSVLKSKLATSVPTSACSVASILADPIFDGSSYCLLIHSGSYSMWMSVCTRLGNSRHVLVPSWHDTTKESYWHVRRQEGTSTCEDLARCLHSHWVATATLNNP